MKEVENYHELEYSQGQGAQSSELDQIMYSVNYCALTQLVSDVKKNKEYKENAIDYDRLPENQMTEEYKQKIISDYEKSYPEKVLTEEEISKLTFTTDTNDFRKRNDTSDDDLVKLNNNYFKGHNTFEESKQDFIKLGMVYAKTNLAVGMEYKKWLDKLKAQDPNDPDCEAKARYLAQNATSPALYLDRGVTAVKQSIVSESQYKYSQSTVLGDINKFKNMSVKEFFDETYMGIEQREEAMKKYTAQLPGATPETKIYDIYKQAELNMGHKDPIPDEKIQQAAMFDYYRDCTTHWTLMGSELIKSNMKKEDRELTEIGAALSSTFEMKHPKSIENWIKTEAPKIIQDNKISGLNSAHKIFSDAVGVKKAYNTEKTDPYIKIVTSSGRSAKSDIDKYICKHCRLKAISATPKEKKIHLAKLMSASTFKRNKLDYNVSGIHDFAKELMKRDAFQQLSDYEITKALTSPRNAYNLQKDLYVKTFGVAEDKKAAYLSEMKQLRANLMPSANRSQEYIAFVNAVDAVSKLEPNSPKFYAANDKLIKAIRDYTKGKKSVRRNPDGRARFDNNMDALAIVEKYIPGSKNFVTEQIERIHKVRNVKPGHKDYVDLKDYGAQKAADRNADRNNAAQKEQPKGLGM